MLTCWLDGQVGIIESGRLGGTCVNVGCVPKKVRHGCVGLFLWTLSRIMHTVRDCHLLIQLSLLCAGDVHDREHGRAVLA